MLDKIKDNPRLIVATLITVGVIALIINAGGNNSTKDTASTESTAQTQTAEEQNVDNTAEEAPATVEQPIGSQPSAGPVAVAAQEETYKASVRKGDNQTVIVRQMVNEYLRDTSQTLSAEQRLYVETNAVVNLPKNDLIFVGQEIVVAKQLLADLVDASTKLTDTQKALWSRYL